MAFRFTGVNRLGRGDAIGISAYPVTMAGWVYPDVTSNTMVLMCIADTNNIGTQMIYVSSTGVVRGHSRNTGASTVVSSTTSYSAATWHHVGGVFTGATNREIWLDGGGYAQDTTNVTFDAGIDNLAVGQRVYNSTADLGLSGRAGECGVWDVALTATEMAILAAGYSPLHIRPGNLIA